MMHVGDDADRDGDWTDIDGPQLLDPQDELICRLLVMGLTHSQVADQVGCSTKTVQRRVADSVFLAEVRGRQQSAVDATTARLVQLGQEALARLPDLLGSDNERIALQAVRTVLEIGDRRHRAEKLETELAGRIASLEESLGELALEEDLL